MHPLLQIQNLSVDFIAESGTTNAVKNISLQVHRGEILAIVGESGSGKSVTSLSVLQLLPSPPARYKGSILFSEDSAKAVDLLSLSTKDMQATRGNEIAMIFQEPMTSLNPVMTCGKQVMEALLLHKNISKEEAKKQTIGWFESKAAGSISHFQSLPAPVERRSKTKGDDRHGYVLPSLFTDM
jgi:peptide/nickel transport system ATP-binding protein